MAAERVTLKNQDEVYCFEGNGKMIYGTIIDVDLKNSFYGIQISKDTIQYWPMDRVTSIFDPSSTPYVEDEKARHGLLLYII